MKNGRSNNEVLADYWRVRAYDARNNSLKYVKLLKTMDLPKYYLLQRKAREYMAYVHWLTSKIDNRETDNGLSYSFFNTSDYRFLNSVNHRKDSEKE